LEAGKRRDKLRTVPTETAASPLTLAASTERVERLFSPQPGSRSKLALGLGMLGCAALGAGVYGAWLAPDAVAAAWPLLIGGLVAVAVAWFSSPAQPAPVRVGELGVIVGDPAEARRVHWHEVSGVRIVGDDLRLESSEPLIVLSLAAHARAAARIVAEASQRIEKRVDISPKAHERLPRLSDAEGELVPAARLQLAGQKCAASGVTITFESDARLCANCAALYHQQHVPATCSSCERSLVEAASVAAARAAG
jgi:hypothetical protein